MRTKGSPKPVDQVNNAAGVFEIQVMGKVSQERAEWFGMRAAYLEDAEAAIVTTLTGSLKDQSALFGLLNALRDMGLKLVAVRRLVPGSRENSINQIAKEKENDNS